MKSRSRNCRHIKTCILFQSYIRVYVSTDGLISVPTAILAGFNHNQFTYSAIIFGVGGILLAAPVALLISSIVVTWEDNIIRMRQRAVEIESSDEEEDTGGSDVPR